MNPTIKRYSTTTAGRITRRPNRPSAPTAAAKLTGLLVAGLLALTAGPGLARAQTPADKAPADPAENAQPAAAAEPTVSVSVTVVRGGHHGDQRLADKPVILQAARPKGPFEADDPEPQHEWTAVTDASGTAAFDGIPADLEQSGLRLHAVTTHGGVSFTSAATIPTDGASLTIPVYESGQDLDAVAIKELQTIAHVWEDHVFFQQFYRLTVTGDTILDTSNLPGQDDQNGLPIELPTDALGIHANGPGQTKVVNSIVYWKGTLKPGQTVPLRLTFSMKASRTTFAYTQRLEYPADSVKVVVPLESRSEQVKVPYFSSVSLAAPGFEVNAHQRGQGMQRRGAFLSAQRSSLPAGKTFRFQMSGLPFDQPYGAWIALVLGLVGAGFVVMYGRRQRRGLQSSRDSGELVDVLVDDREALLDELALLENDWEAGHVSELEYERESLLLRERLALILKKLDELDQEAA